MTERIVVGIHEAKTQFSKLVKRAQAGDEIIVESYGHPVVQIVALTPLAAPRKPGMLGGKVRFEPGFDDLPEGFDEAFGA